MPPPPDEGDGLDGVCVCVGEGVICEGTVWSEAGMKLAMADGPLVAVGRLGWTALASDTGSQATIFTLRFRR